MTPQELKDAVWTARLLVDGRVIDVTRESSTAIAKALLHVAGNAPLLAPAFIAGVKELPPGAVTGAEICWCGAPLPHAAPCQFTTDPEAT